MAVPQGEVGQDADRHCRGVGVVARCVPSPPGRERAGGKMHTGTAGVGGGAGGKMHTGTAAVGGRGKDAYQHRWGGVAARCILAPPGGRGGGYMGIAPEKRKFLLQAV